MAGAGAQLVNAKALAGLFDITERRVQMLAKEEVIPKAERGKYLFVASIKGYIAYLRKAAFGGEAGETAGTSDMQSQRTRLYRANADKSELELAVLRGEFLRADVVGVVWGKQAEAIRQKLLAIPVKLAGELHGIESKREIQAIATRFVHEACDELAESDGPTYKAVSDSLESGEG